MIIWLSSYPRSGNTFLRTLIKKCLGKDTYSIYNDQDIGSDPGLAEITGHRTLAHRFGSSGFNLTPLRENKEVFFLKTHEATPALVEPGDKIIYIIRDGRQATLSFHNYLRNFHKQNISPLELSLGFDFPGGSWSDHVAEWQPNDRDDTHLLYFEKMITAPEEAIDQVAAFSCVLVKEYAIPRFGELQQINSRFFRQGKCNSFRDELSGEEQSIFWLRSYREMQGYGYTDSQPPFVENQTPDFLRTVSTGLNMGLSYLDEVIATLKADHAKQMQEKEHYVESQQKLILEKEQYIENQKKLVREKEQYIENLQKLIQDKGVLIGIQKKSIQDKDQHAESQQELIKRKDQHIENQLKQMQEKDKNIDNQWKLIQGKEEYIESQLWQMANFDSQLATRDSKIDQICQSWSWRLTWPLRKADLFVRDNRKFRRQLRMKLQGSK